MRFCICLGFLFGFAWFFFKFGPSTNDKQRSAAILKPVFIYNERVLTKTLFSLPRQTITGDRKILIYVAFAAAVSTVRFEADWRTMIRYQYQTDQPLW